MANADGENDRHIIIGVGHSDTGEKQFFGIKKDEFIDSATYQQIIRENIEPDVNLEYFLHEFDNKFYGIFRISQCPDKPYLMKKQFKNLNKGDGWIRKGTHQDRMIRNDFEIIYKNKFESQNFDGELSLNFSDSDEPELKLVAIREFILPSQAAKNRIQAALDVKKTSRSDENQDLPNIFQATMKLAQGMSYPFYRSYDDMTIEELEKAFEEVDSEFYEDNLYTLYEDGATKINVKIFNHGKKYIEDGSIELIFPNRNGFIISPKVFRKPIHSPDIASMIVSSPIIFYPSVEEKDSTIIVHSNIGDIKHNKSTQIFREPIRIKAIKNLIGESILIHCKIFGKNIIKPISKTLKIHIV